MLSRISRRRFVGNAAVVSLASLIPRFVGAAASATRKITVLTDQEIGTVRPEFHGQFAEHLADAVPGLVRGVVCGLEKIQPSPTLTGTGVRPSST